MMILWRYLVGNYLKIFFLAMSVFIALLLTSRLEEIAHFISLQASVTMVILFIAYQIPYILPIAGAVAALLAAFLLFYRLSTTQELTTLRFSGLSLYFITSPLLILAMFLSCTTFYLTSECATYSHLKTRKMLYELACNNPLLLISHARIPKLRNAYIQMDPTRHGAHNLFIALFNTTTNQINCLLSREISLDHEKITAEHLSLITSSPENNTLIIENQSYIEGTAADVASFLTSAKGWKIANDHLTLRLLCVRKKEYQETRAHASSKDYYKQYSKKIRKCDLELMRRVSVSLAPFTFTLMGIALGIHISRHQGRKRIILVTSLALFTLIAFFAAKELSSFFYLATTLFFLPHTILIFISCHALYRVTRGIE